MTSQSKFICVDMEFLLLLPFTGIKGDEPNSRKTTIIPPPQSGRQLPPDILSCLVAASLSPLQPTHQRLHAVAQNNPFLTEVFENACCMGA